MKVKYINYLVKISDPLHVQKKITDINFVCTHSDIVHAHNSATVIHILLEVFFLKKKKDKQTALNTKINNNIKINNINIIFTVLQHNVTLILHLQHCNIM